jgi:hypothetical protein
VWIIGVGSIERHGGQRQRHESMLWVCLIYELALVRNVVVIGQEYHKCRPTWSLQDLRRSASILRSVLYLVSANCSFTMRLRLRRSLAFRFAFKLFIVVFCVVSFKSRESSPLGTGFLAVLRF